MFERRNSQGAAGIYVISWTEVNGDDVAKSKIPLPPNFPTQPLKPGSVRAQVSVSYNRTITDDVPFEMYLDLPPGATLTSCTPPPEETVQCQPHEPEQNPLFNQKMSHVDVTGTIKAQQHTPQPSTNSGISFFIDVSGVHGINFTTTRTRAKVQYPAVFFAGPSSFSPSYTVMSQALLSSPEDVSWSEQPSATGANLPSLVGWFVRYPSDSAKAAVPLTGVRESVVRDDSTRTFWSGIALGIAGAFLVVFLQASLVAYLKWRAKRPGFAE